MQNESPAFLNSPYIVRIKGLHINPLSIQSFAHEPENKCVRIKLASGKEHEAYAPTRKAAINVLREIRSKMENAIKREL